MELVFMFVTRTTFPVYQHDFKDSIVNVLQTRYGKNLIKNNKNFKNYDFKYKNRY